LIRNKATTTAWVLFGTISLKSRVASASSFYATYKLIVSGSALTEFSWYALTIRQTRWNSICPSNSACRRATTQAIWICITGKGGSASTLSMDAFDVISISCEIIAFIVSSACFSNLLASCSEVLSNALASIWCYA